MESHVLDEITQACRNNDPVKLSAVFRHTKALRQEDLLKILEPTSHVPICPMAAEFFALIGRSQLSESFLKKHIGKLTEIARREPEAITNLLSAGQFHYNSMLMEIAGVLELEEAVPHLHDLLSDLVNPEDVETAITALGRIGDENSVPKLKMYLDLSQPALAKAALKAVGGCAGEESLEIILDILGKNKEMDMAALDLLAHMGYAKGIQAVAGFLKSRDVDLRNRAIDKLVETGCLAIPFLHELLGDQNPDVRIVVCNTLGFIKNKESVKQLLHAAKDEDPNVRYAAFEALGRIGSKSCIMHLPTGVLDEEPQVRVAAVTAIEENIEDAFTVRGIRNFFEMRQENIEIAAMATVVANAKKVFLFLSDNEIFRELCYKFFYRIKSSREIAELVIFLKNSHKEGLVRELESYGVMEKETKAFKVLVVDDSKIMHKIIGSALAPARHRVSSAYHGHEALDALGKENFDIILTDMNMPEMNGIELIRKIREDAKYNSIPIVMITTQSDNLDKELAISVGANYFLTKPFKNEKLLGIVDDYLHGREPRGIEI